MNNPVIVMALYDIGRDNWSNFTLSYDTYLHWMRNTLSLDANIIIYAEHKFIDSIKKFRKEFDPYFKKTIIIEQPLEELDCYKKYYYKLSKLMSSQNFKEKVHHDVPEMNKPLYNIIMFNKMYFLKHAKTNNYFNSDLFIWADAGGLRDNISQYKNVSWPSLEKINNLDKNKITFFTHSKNIRIDNNEFHALSQVRYIQGTCFFVPIDMIDNFTDECDKTINECIENNYIGSDEKIFDITYLKNPNNYNLIECTWRTYFKLFNSYNSKNKVFIDLGSHECQGLSHLINELKIDNDWKVHAFEPNDLIDTYEHARKFNLDVTVHRKAAWIRETEKMTFNQYGANGTSQGSLLPDSGGGKNYTDFFQSINVKTIDILEFIKTFNTDQEIYIKMDIEFSEYIVLDYMLQQGWPKNIKTIWIAWHGKDNIINQDKIKYITKKITETGTIVSEWT